MTLNDPDFIERCHAYWDGLTPPEDADVLMAEVAKDPAKKAWFEAFGRGLTRLHDAMNGPLPEGVEARLEQAISSEVARTESARLVSTAPKSKFPWPAAVASVLLIGVVGLVAPRMWQWVLYVPGDPLPSLQQAEVSPKTTLTDAQLEAEMVDAWTSVDTMAQDQTQLADAVGF